MRIRIDAAAAIVALTTMGATNAAQAATCSPRALAGIWAFTTHANGDPADETSICLVRFDVNGRITGSSCFSAVNTIGVDGRLSGRISIAKDCTGSGTLRQRRLAGKVKAVLNPQRRALSISDGRGGSRLILHEQRF